MSRTKLKYVLLVAIFFALANVARCAYGQSNRKSEFGSIPVSLQPSLAERLSAFVAHQRKGEWEQASTFLGNYYFALGWKRTTYLPDQKRWMVSRLRSNGIVTFSPQRTIFGTDILNLPLNRKYWQVVGDATFSRDDRTLHDQAGFLVYRDKNVWFFVPLDVNQYGTSLVIPPTAPNKALQLTAR